MLRRTSWSRRLSGPLGLAGVLLGSATALAHISLERGVYPIDSRYGDTQIKEAPCGKAGGTRGTKVYHFKPGDTIAVSVLEYIAHPGYFRIAFDQDGDNDFKDPASIKPVNNFRTCLNDNGADKCGTDDFYNNSTVLMDNLDPHVPELGALSTKTWTWQVKLPNVTCDNCTLQIIQVMEDANLHGPYNPNGAATEGGSYVADVYHQCIDLVLSPDADPSQNPSVVPTMSADGGVSGVLLDAGPGTNPFADGGAEAAGDGDGPGAGGGMNTATGDAGTGASGGPSGSSGDGTGAEMEGDPHSSSSGCSLNKPGRAPQGSWLVVALALLSGGLVARRRHAARKLLP